MIHVAVKGRLNLKCILSVAGSLLVFEQRRWPVRGRLGKSCLSGGSSLKASLCLLLLSAGLLFILCLRKPGSSESLQTYGCADQGLCECEGAAVW